MHLSSRHDTGRFDLRLHSSGLHLLAVRFIYFHSIMGASKKPAAKSKAAPKKARSRGAVTWDTVREVAMSFPGVQETTSYGTTAFKVNGKLLARFHQDRESLVVKVEFAAREVLMGAKPDTFYLTDHYVCWPYVLVRIENVELSDLRQIIGDAWRNNASKRAVAAWDAGARS